MFNFTLFLEKHSQKNARIYESKSARDARLYGTLGIHRTPIHNPLHITLYEHGKRDSYKQTVFVPKTYVLIYENKAFTVQNNFIYAKGYKRIPFKTQGITPFSKDAFIPSILYTLTKTGMQPIQGGEFFIKECIKHNAPIYTTEQLYIA